MPLHGHRQIDTDRGTVFYPSTGIPSDASAGYAPGCIALDEDATSAPYAAVNEGSVTSSDFNGIATVDADNAWTGSNTVTWSPSGSSVSYGFKTTGTSTNTYGSRMYNGNSQFSAAFLVGDASTHYSESSTGGATAAFAAFIDVAGIKTANNDITAAFAGRVNITADQTLGDMAGSTLYLRNSAQALSGSGGNNLFACHLDYMYMGTGSSTRSLRGHWIDVLEQATTPAASRDWIIFGTQLTAGALGTSGGNITAFYCNLISSDLETQLTQKAAWFRGNGKICIDLSGWTLKREATPTDQYGAAQIVLANVSSFPVSIFTYAGDPSGKTTVGKHAKGAICIDTTNGRLYMNVGTVGSPTWSYVTNWT